MYNLNKVDAKNLTDKEIESLYIFDQNNNNKYNFLNIYDNLDKFKNQFLSNFYNDDKELFLLKKDTSICGIICFTKTIDFNEKPENQLKILINENMNEDLISTINSFIKSKLNEHGEILLQTYNDELTELINKYNYKTKFKSNCYTLDRGDINVDMLTTWIHRFETKNKDLKMKYTTLISEEYIQQYCDLFTETMKDMPDNNEDAYESPIITQEKQRKINNNFRNNNMTHNCYMVFNSENQMIAKSNLRVTNTDARFPYQFMVGVKREYRNRGIGKWLYACMYKRLYENVQFEKVLVKHHPDNISAIKVSQSVGYKFKFSETHYLLTKDYK
ncbi:GNAT family N-acetyltransferase [Oceanirhabdus seepicola]|uniref:GNAT family N-acetyltransferase n=1 Tax=Oceanirhabdus seepicola TaxID=2828781 RepID=A0A9J6P307_9CLOT|nr:GNAT family N-acetyltransferase [Oceanirhabdus seepicola]MCM1990574.1 GNAT family N-acetyltransferase [Oceanirhabdus seepicola]